MVSIKHTPPVPAGTDPLSSCSTTQQPPASHSQPADVQPIKLVYMASGLNELPGLIARAQQIRRKDAPMHAERLVKLVRHILFLACELEAFPVKIELIYNSATEARLNSVPQDSPAVQKLAAVMGEDEEHLLQQARTCLRLYSPHAPSLLGDVFSLERLDREVAAITGLVDSHVQELEPFGYKLVHKYEQIKKTFPTIFRPDRPRDT